MLASLLMLQLASSDSQSNDGLQGKKVAVFGAHLNGNLGDIMETTPMLIKLKEWGLFIDIYSASYLALALRIDPKLTHIFQYVDAIFSELPSKHVQFYSKYDVFIVAPGPSPHHKDTLPCVGTIPQVWFGMSLVGDRNGVWMYSKVKQCLALVTLRESYSLSVFQNDSIAHAQLQGALPPLMLTGDYSYSYVPVTSVLSYWRDFYASALVDALVPLNWVLVFSRGTNFKFVEDRTGKFTRHVRIDEAARVLTLLTVNGVEESMHLDSIVFATSDITTDQPYFDELVNRYKIQPSRLIVLGTVEAMWGLISLASKVYSDRYHPAVATLLHQKPLIAIQNDAENAKIRGVSQMKGYSPHEVKAMNDQGFAMLKSVIVNSNSVLKTLGLKGGKQQRD